MALIESERISGEGFRGAEKKSHYLNRPTKTALRHSQNRQQDKRENNSPPLDKSKDWKRGAGHTPLKLDRIHMGNNDLGIPLNDLGIPIEASPYPQETGSILQALAVEAFENDGFLFYSRSPNHYAGRQQKFDDVTYSWKRVRASVDWLDRQGVLEHDKVRPGPNNSYSSRMRLNAFYAARACEIAMNGKPAKPSSLLVMRGKKPKGEDKGREVDFNFSKAMKRDAEWLKTYIQGIKTSFEGMDGNVIALQSLDPERPARRIIDMRQNIPKRVFSNKSIRYGGRIYGPWYLNLTKAERARIRIDGEPIAEVDFKSLHPRLCYLSEGWDIDQDPYQVGNYRREVIKAVLNTAINAEDFESAIDSLLDCRRKRKRPSDWPFKGNGAREKADRALRAVMKAHPLIAKYFCSGAGLKFQRLDSDLMIRILQDLEKSNIPALPLHDAVLCKASDIDQVKETMINHFRALFPDLRIGEVLPIVEIKHPPKAD